MHTNTFATREPVINALLESLIAGVLIVTSGIALNLWSPDNPGVSQVVIGAIVIPSGFLILAVLGDALEHYGFGSKAINYALLQVGVVGAQIWTGAVHALSFAISATILMMLVAGLLR